MLNAAGDKSFVDDLVASGYCKCESSLCCYEALRFIPRFYDLFFSVSKFGSGDSWVIGRWVSMVGLVIGVLGAKAWLPHAWLVYLKCCDEDFGRVAGFGFGHPRNDNAGVLR